MFSRLLDALGLLLPGKRLPRRDSRVVVVPLESLTFRFTSKPVLGTCPVLNISTNGLGLLRARGQLFPGPGEVLRGVLVFPNREVDVEIKIVHLGPMIVGCQFIDLSENGLKQVEAYFAAELSGMGLTAVNPAILKKEPLGKPRLYRGRNNCELFFVEHKGKVIRFELSFFGNFIEGNSDGRVRFGYLEDDDRGSKARYKGTTLVRLVSGMPRETVDAACRLVDHVTELEPELRDQIIGAIGQALVVDLRGR
jgi:hypothetical protein